MIKFNGSPSRVNTINMKQMLEFCSDNINDISLEIRGQSLCISNTSISTLVDIDELTRCPSKKVKLSTKAVSLIVSFLKSCNVISSLYLGYDMPFSISSNIDDHNTVQIFTVHDYV